MDNIRSSKDWVFWDAQIERFRIVLKYVNLNRITFKINDTLMQLNSAAPFN